MKLVKKIIFRNKETYNRLYQGSELLFEVQKEVEWKGLTFTALERSRIRFVKATINPTIFPIDMQYSYDGVNWNEWGERSIDDYIYLNPGEKLYVKGDNQYGLCYEDSLGIQNSYFIIDIGKVEASGNIMSILDNGDCTRIDVPEYCFYDLFKDCIALVNAPELPATTLSDRCYQYMFENCTALVNAPELPATTLSDRCYNNMFHSCTSLITAPSLPITSLVSGCYSGMFSACTSLVTPPELPATTLAQSCYSGMFSGCTSLVTAPELPATALEKNCYNDMFHSCTSLTQAPELKATTLADGCYEGMFHSCTSLTQAPELKATTLAYRCYRAMFYNCTSLTNAPELPATVLADECYYLMFYSCTNLNYIKCDAKTYVNNYFDLWVDKVSKNGDFYCYDSSIFPTGASGIPTGWTVHSEVEHKEYDELYVSGRYNFKIPKGDGTYYVIDTKNDCEVDIISDNDKSSLTGKIFTSNSEGDVYEWDLFFTGYNLYFDLSFKNSRRLYWRFGTLNANTKYTIGGSNGNYLGTDRALYVNGSKKASSTTKSTYNNTSDIAFIGENVTDFYVGNIKIYESTGLVYHIVPIMYNGNIEFYDKVNKRFIEITSRPDSAYAKTRTTGEKVII